MDITNFFRWDEFWQFQDVTLWRLLASFCLAAVLSWTIALVYQKTHRGPGYSQSMTQTLVLISVIVSLVMIVIGSNIARAFSLVGALSIIRFRTAVKNTRDTSYIFLTLAIGMAAGSRFYLTAIAATALFIVLILILDKTNYGAGPSPLKILKLRLPAHVNPDKDLKTVFNNFLSQWQVISHETVQMGSLLEITYQVQLKTGMTAEGFLEKLRVVNENQKIQIYYPDQEFSL